MLIFGRLEFRFIFKLKEEVIRRCLCVGEGLKACRPPHPHPRARPDLGHPWLLVARWGC